MNDYFHPTNHVDHSYSFVRLVEKIYHDYENIWPNQWLILPLPLHVQHDDILPAIDCSIFDCPISYFVRIFTRYSNKQKKTHRQTIILT